MTQTVKLVLLIYNHDRHDNSKIKLDINMSKTKPIIHFFFFYLQLDKQSI